MRLTLPHPSGHSQKNNKMFMTKTLLMAVSLVSLALFLTFLPSRVVQGGSPLSQQAVEHQANIIDGSVNPEMIQDRDAFRLFFLVAATDANPNPEEKERQRAILSALQFSEKELQVSSEVLAEYRAQHEAAVQRYNDAVALAASVKELPDGKRLGAEVDDLAMAAKAKLESSISASSSLRLYAHVQREKSKMRVTTE